MTANLSLRDEILDFWFGRPDAPSFGKPRVEWFRKDPSLAKIRHDPRFQRIVDSIETRRRSLGTR